MKKLLSVFFIIVVCLSFSVPAFAAGYLVDDADLLSANETKKLEKLMNDVTEKYNCEIIIITERNHYGYIETYVNDYYDDNHLGLGPTFDGIMLYLSMADRDWWVITNGSGNTAIDVDGIDYIMKSVLKNLGNDNYYKGFESFVKQSEKFLKQAEKGDPYRYGNFPARGLENPGANVLISIIIGAAIAIVSCSGMKNALKTVQMQAKADNYVRQNSLNVVNGREGFLYRKVSRTVRQTSSSSSSGGSSGGGGGSRSSSGGKF